MALYAAVRAISMILRMCKFGSEMISNWFKSGLGIIQPVTLATLDLRVSGHFGPKVMGPSMSICGSQTGSLVDLVGWMIGLDRSLST